MKNFHEYTTYSVYHYLDIYANVFDAEYICGYYQAIYLCPLLLVILQKVVNIISGNSSTYLRIMPDLFVKLIFHFTY